MDWDINLFNFGKTDQTKFLIAMYSDLDFFTKFNINMNMFNNFQEDLRKNYAKFNNPFHNFLHGVNVCHSCFYLYKTTRLKNYVSDLQAFSQITSGLCHDVGHTGRTNSFEINTLSKLAFKYHDISPLEQMHAALSFNIMLKSQNDILGGLNGNDFTKFRKFFISNILSTDMKKHSELINRVNKEFIEPNEKISEKNMEEKDTELITNLFLHTADLSGPVKNYEICYIWSKRVNQEFDSQVKEEIRLNLPVTPYFKNLHDDEVYYNGEFGFMKFVIQPLWSLSNLFLENDLTIMMENFENNLNIMARKLETVKKCKESQLTWKDSSKEDIEIMDINPMLYSKKQEDS